ncbi:unnamed protein product [Protopolystoma xenopodis]|uniref:Uncharacterized protein n=1 Tax=Protopolystoma xenopodis TaxID=117903 RepID=A0A3S5B9T6_9PLAT|nr:unnamed protein product [Protopolystoma xenopodis]
MGANEMCCRKTRRRDCVTRRCKVSQLSAGAVAFTWPKQHSDCICGQKRLQSGLFTCKQSPTSSRPPPEPEDLCCHGYAVSMPTGRECCSRQKCTHYGTPKRSQVS